MKTFVVVRGIFPGVHYWPSASKSGHPHLAYKHFHNFHFTVKIEVPRSRQIEFISESRRIASRMATWLKTHTSSSCEEIAAVLYKQLFVDGCCVVEVEVSEDGLCGAMVRKEKQE